MQSIEQSLYRFDDRLNTWNLSFDLTIYSVDAVKKAAYKFAGDFSVKLESSAESRVNLALSFLTQTSMADAERVLKAFLNEVVDQDLREKIAKDTELTRHLILAQAFSNTTLLQDE